jgi:hypothetical protein
VRPAVPLRRAARLGLVTAAASRSVLAASFAWILLTLASARLAWVPPAGPVLSTWGAGADPGPLVTAWALLGPLIVTAGLLTVTLRLRRRR